jgi:hypothetical protein
MSLKQTAKIKVSDLNRDVNEFRKCYQPRANVVNDKNGDLSDSHSILNR